MWMHLLVFYISPKLCKFFFNIFFPLCSSDYVVSTDLSSGFLILYFTSSNLWLKPFSEFFILVIVIFTLTISTWFYFIISIFYSCSLFDRALFFHMFLWFFRHGSFQFFQHIYNSYFGVFVCFVHHLGLFKGNFYLQLLSSLCIGHNFLCMSHTFFFKVDILDYIATLDTDSFLPLGLTLLFALIVHLFV